MISYGISGFLSRRDGKSPSGRAAGKDALMVMLLKAFARLDCHGDDNLTV